MKPYSPLVTIVTPSYNQANFLEATICSVLKQDYPSIEYFVIDGGSTDDSVKIIKKYAKHITWWISEKDSGQAEAINKGLQRAKGDITGWLNSDDIYQAGAISAAVRAFQANPRAGVVYGDAWSMDEKSDPFNLMKARQYSLVDLLAFCSICQPAAFMRREVLEQAGYLDQAYHYVLDHYLWIRMARLAPMKYVPQTWASSRYHDQAKNRKSSEGFALEADAMMDKLQNDPQYLGLFRDNKKYITAGVDRYKAYYLTDAGKPGNALKLYFKAFLLRPGLVIKDWKHVFLAKLSLLGLRNIRKPYDQIRSHRINRMKRDSRK
jgi:glycosyltransferase involved in cell wall biosynthesis